MKRPVACRIPVLTAAPLPMLYGWLMTRAPAAVARRAVSSVDPSSTTTISCHDAASRSASISGAIAGASLKAGITTDVDCAFVSGIGQQPFDDAVPGDRACPFEPGGAQGFGA